MSEALQMQLKQLFASLETNVTHLNQTESPSDLIMDIEQLAQVTKIAISNNLTEELEDTLHEREREEELKIKSLCETDMTDSKLMSQQLDLIDEKSRQIKLKASLVKRNMDLSSKQLVDKALTHEQMRRTRMNIESTISSVKQCLQGLGHVNQIHELLKSNRRVAAVQNLQDLQNLDMAELQTVGLGSLVSKTVPMLSQEITQATLTSLNSFFEHNAMSLQSDFIGQRVFDLVKTQRQAWDQLCREHPHLESFRFNSPVEMAYRRSNSNFLTVQQINVDLKPLLEADMVFSKLGKGYELKNYIDSQFSSFSDNLVTTSYEDLVNKLQTIVGFCLIDRVLSRYLPQIRPSKSVDDQWERISQNISRFISSFINQVEDMKELKSRLGLVMDTLYNFEFNVSSIGDLFSMILGKVCDKSVEDMKSKAQEQFEKSDQMQLVVTTEMSYESVMQIVWYDGPNIDDLSLPFAFPFSEMYVILCKCLRVLLHYGESFLNHFQENQNYVVTEVSKCIDNAFDIIIRGYCDPAIRGNNRELLVQTLVNLQMFHLAALKCERELAKMRNGRKGSVVLESTNLLEQKTKSAETRVYVLLEETVLGFFAGNSFSWTTTELQETPTSMVLEMTAYLLTMANTILQRLPPEVRSLAFFNLAENVNTGLKNILLEIPPDATEEALTNFDTDLQFLEKSLWEIASGTDTSMPLLESRQMLDLLRSEDPVGEFNNPAIRTRKYDRLDAKSVSALLQRIKPELIASLHSDHTQTASVGRQGTLMHKPSIMRYLGGGSDK